MDGWVLVGAAMATARRAQSLQQQDLADHCSVRKQTISDWERGVQRPSLETLASLEEYLKLPRGHFLRAGGFVATNVNSESAIMADARLRPEQRQLLMVALEAFLKANADLPYPLVDRRLAPRDVTEVPAVR